jgi:uncharacterized protein YdeI (YjbR/CyaY-like superfamily)
MDQAKPKFFETPAAFRRWLEKNHKIANELLVGYHKVGTGRPCMTWAESVAEALCFGWIDGIRRRVDENCYTIRFTPRRPRSKWSAVNLRLIQELEAAGRMTDAGRAVHAARVDKDAAGYTYEPRPDVTFDRERLRTFKANRSASKFFEAQPPGYRRRVTWWVMSAKQEQTRDARMQKLIDASAKGKRLL